MIEEYAVIREDGYMQCVVCKIWKPITEFTPSKRSPTGYSIHCKSCKNLSKTKQANMDTIPEDQLTWQYDAQGACWIYTWTFKLESTAWKTAYRVARECGLVKDNKIHVSVQYVDPQKYRLVTNQTPSPNPPYKNYKIRKEIVDGKLQCSKCGKWKPLYVFGPSKINSTGYASWCNHCWKLNQLYHITSEAYDALLIAQDGKCAICRGSNSGGRSDYFHVDHDHITGKVRGLLCSPCNTALGGFKEDIATLQKAIAYLQSHQE